MAYDDNKQDALPESLVTELKVADAIPAIITARVDRAIDSLVREQFGTHSEKAREKAPVWFALAASVLLAVLLVPDVLQVDAGISPNYSDVDRSGQIDIADVLALARRKQPSVSVAELDAFAARIVSLNRLDDAS